MAICLSHNLSLIQICVYIINCRENWSHGAVMSNRCLAPGERFEVRLEEICSRSTGSIKVGITPLHPNKMTFPRTISDLKNEIWAITGTGVLFQGKEVKKKYGSGLDKLKVECRNEMFGSVVRMLQ